MTRLQYCLNASTIRPTPLLEKIRIAATTGYAAIELWHDEIEQYVAAGGTLTDLKKHVGATILAPPASSRRAAPTRRTARGSELRRAGEPPAAGPLQAQPEARAHQDPGLQRR